jgi:hypothetical protein
MPPQCRVHRRCRRRHHRDRGHRIDDLRDQRHRADTAAIAARLAALGDDHVHAPLGGLYGLRDRRDLKDHARPDIVRLPHQVARVAEGERDHRRPRLQRVAKRLGIQSRRNVVDREMAIRQLPHHVDVALDGGRSAEQRADAAEPTLVGDGSRKLCRRGRSHGRQDDRRLDAEQVTKGCLEHHGSSLACLRRQLTIAARLLCTRQPLQSVGALSGVGNIAAAWLWFGPLSGAVPPQ